MKNKTATFQRIRKGRCGFVCMVIIVIKVMAGRNFNSVGRRYKDRFYMKVN